MLVVDASVVAPAVADSGPDGDLCRERLAGEVLAAPDLLRIEVLSVIRRHLNSGELSTRQASNAIADLMSLPIVVYPTAPLLKRCWEFRGNLTAYDACYVSLAEAIDATVLTADARLAKAPGSRCRFDVI